MVPINKPLYIKTWDEADWQRTGKQFMTLAASDIAVQAVGSNGQPEYPDIDVLLPDGYMYVGVKAHEEMEACQFLITDRLQ